jgi:hypothetical protein
VGLSEESRPTKHTLNCGFTQKKFKNYRHHYKSGLLRLPWHTECLFRVCDRITLMPNILNCGCVVRVAPTWVQEMLYARWHYICTRLTLRKLLTYTSTIANDWGCSSVCNLTIYLMWLSHFVVPILNCSKFKVVCRIFPRLRSGILLMRTWSIFAFDHIIQM